MPLTFTEPNFVVRNISGSTLTILDVISMAPLEEVDLFALTDIVSKTTILNELRPPLGKIYIDINVRKVLQIVDLQFFTLSTSGLNTKGDLLTYDGYSGQTRFGVGEDGYVLTSDSSVSTGLRWSPPGATAYSASDIQTDISEFDGYVLTSEDNVQSAIVTLGNSIRQFSEITDGYYSSIVNIDFQAQRMLNLGTISGNIQFTTSALSPGLSVVVRFTADGTARNLTFPAWNFFVPTPATITANKVGVLSLLSWGTTDAEVDAAWVESI